jgi:hypothetical protein
MAVQADSSTDIEQWVLLLQYAQSFPDYPTNFQLPLTANPDGIIPRRGHSLLISSIIVAILMPAVVGIRLYVRSVMQKRFGLDDVLIIPALVRTCYLYQSHEQID